MTSKQPVLDLL